MIDEFKILLENDKYIGSILVDEIETGIIDRQINGYNVLNFSISMEVENVKYLEKGNKILFIDNNTWHEYIIAGTKYDINGIKSVECESSLYSLLGNFVEYVDITGNTVIKGLEKIINSADPITNWNIGKSDIAGSFYLQRSRKTLKECVFAWTSKVNGEVVERIEIINSKIYRYIDILKSCGKNTGKTIFDDREISEMSITLPAGDVYTKAYGYGACEALDDSGNNIHLTFKDVEWIKENGDPVDKPLGQSWVALGESFKNKYGLLIDGVRYHKTTLCEESNVTVKEELLKRTYNMLLNNVKDNTQYSITSYDLHEIGVDTEDMYLGDSIGVVISRYDLKLQARVYRFKQDIKDPSKNTFELTNYIPTITSSISKNDNLMKENNDKLNGLVARTLFESVLDKWNNEINKETTTLVHGDPLNGLIAYNASSKELATKATRLKGGSLQIANSKENGDFKWTTVLTGDGIIASSIYTGLIKGNLFDIDLDTGILKMGVRNDNGVINNPVFYLDENGLEIKGNVSIESVANLNEKVETLENKLDVSLSANLPLTQVFERATNLFIPDYTKQNLIITATCKLLDGTVVTNNVSYVWKRKTESGESNLVTGETANKGVLTISRNVLEFHNPLDYICTVTFNGRSVTKTISIGLNIIGEDGENGKDAILLHVDSSNGNIFKNSLINTTLTVSIIVAGEIIDTQQKLVSFFGDNTYLQWKRKSFGEKEFTLIPDEDSRLSDCGFILTLNAQDINTKAVFKCELLDK